MALRRGTRLGGLSLILASSILLGMPTRASAESITGKKGDTLWVGEDWSGNIFITDEICRTALDNLFDDFERDFSDATVRTTELYNLRKRFDGFFNIYFGRNVENLSNERLISMYQSNQAAIDLDKIVQNIPLIMEARLPYIERKEGEVAFYTPANFGLASTDKWRMKFVLDKVGEYWEIVRAYSIQDIPGSPEHEFTILYNRDAGPSDWVLGRGRFKREKTIPSEPSPKVPSQPSPVTEQAQTPTQIIEDNWIYPGYSYENITSAGVGDILPDFEIKGKKFDIGISGVFRIRLCEADLYDRPLENSRKKFYDFFIVRYCARSKAGQGLSFINANSLILERDGRIFLPYT